MRTISPRSGPAARIHRDVADEPRSRKRCRLRVAARTVYARSMTDFDASRLDELNTPIAAYRSSELIELVAAGKTDLFCPPDGGPPTLNAPALLAKPHDGDF